MARDLIPSRRTVPIVAVTDWRPDTRTWPYTVELGERIAADVAEGVSIHAQRQFDPLTIPPAAVILTWRAQYPAFGVMMKHADRVRADLLREQALEQADSGSGAAPRIAIQVATRLKMADRLDGGTSTGIGDLGARLGEQPTALSYSDDELAALAAVGLADRVGATG